MRRFETKIILYWLSEGQTHFGMPRGAKMEFGPQGTKIELLFIQILLYLHGCTTSGNG